MVLSEDSYVFNDAPLTRPAPRDVNLNEMAHEIVISAVTGAQSKEAGLKLTSPSLLTNEFNKLGAVEYITRDQPIVVSEPAAGLPTFTMSQPQANVNNVTRPAFTKEYLINLQGPKIPEPQVAVSKDLNVSLTRPALQEPHSSFNKDANITVTGPSIPEPHYNVSLDKPEIKLPQFSLNKDVHVSATKPSVPPPFTLASDWSISAEQPTKHVPKVSVQSGHFVSGQVVIDAGLAKPHFNTEYESAQPVTSGSKFDPYEILRAYSTTSTKEILRHFNGKLFCITRLTASRTTRS